MGKHHHKHKRDEDAAEPDKKIRVEEIPADPPAQIETSDTEAVQTTEVSQKEKDFDEDERKERQKEASRKSLWSERLSDSAVEKFLVYKNFEVKRATMYQLRSKGSTYEVRFRSPPMHVITAHIHGIGTVDPKEASDATKYGKYCTVDSNFGREDLRDDPNCKKDSDAFIDCLISRKNHVVELMFDEAPIIRNFFVKDILEHNEE